MWQGEEKSGGGSKRVSRWNLLLPGDSEHELAEVRARARAAAAVVESYVALWSSARTTALHHGPAHPSDPVGRLLMEEYGDGVRARW